jgi:hypothetical protein
MQTNKTLAWAVLLSGALFLTSCGGSKEEAEEKETKNEEKVSLSDAMSTMQDMAKQAEEDQKNGPIETIDFRQLKEMLPNTADGLARKEASGEKTGMMGFKISTATARYANTDNSQSIDLTIVDAGGSGALMGLAAWSMIEVDKETETNYEKTGSMGDYKTYEQYNKTNKDGELAVLVAKRFVVTAKGNGVGMEQLKTVVNDLDLSKLAALK